MLRLLFEFGMAVSVDRHDALERDADTAEFCSHMGKSVRGPIEVYDQALHCRPKSSEMNVMRRVILASKVLARDVPLCRGCSIDFTAPESENQNSP